MERNQTMSSTQEVSSDPVRGRRNKAEKTDKQSRRTWSPREESVLLASLKELVAKGWKSDNGFRGGYLQRLEEAMSKEFVGTDIQVSPHINSKLTIWKKNYYSIWGILQRSGVGFNLDGKHTIDCEQEQWNQIVKCDGNARTMRHKSWPMYEDWKEIFGKDRATGANAEDMMDAVNDMIQKSHQEEDNQEDGKDEPIHEFANEEDVSVNDVGDNSVCHSDKAEPSVKSTGNGKGKKRKSQEVVAPAVLEFFREINRDTNARLDSIASRIGYNYDVDEAKKDSFRLLENIDGLSLDEKFDVCEIFADKPERLVIFKGFPAVAQAKYVQRLLKSKHT